MGEEKKEEKAPGNRIDGLLQKLLDRVSKGISTFVASIFFILTIGIFIGVYVASREPEYIYIALGTPAVLGLVSYYNRDIAAIVFFVFLIFFFFIA